MEVYEAVRTVLAVRDFQSRLVPDSLVKRIVEAARLTGSSTNGQPWHFIIVQDHDTLRQLGLLVTSGRYNAQAAFAIVVAIDRSSQFGVSDANRAIQSMVLTAWSEGVGSNWTGWVGVPRLANSERLSQIEGGSVSNPKFRTFPIDEPKEDVLGL